MNKITSCSYSNKIHSKKWTKEETKKFYKLLEIFGPDFDMISNDIFFKNRSRQQILNKFRREDQIHKDWVDNALNRKQKLKSRKMSKRIRKLNNFLAKEAIILENDQISKTRKKNVENGEQAILESTSQPKKKIKIEYKEGKSSNQPIKPS